jgi:hypothetical protein
MQWYPRLIKQTYSTVIAFNASLRVLLTTHSPLAVDAFITLSFLFLLLRSAPYCSHSLFISGSRVGGLFTACE